MASGWLSDSGSWGVCRTKAMRARASRSVSISGLTTEHTMIWRFAELLLPRLPEAEESAGFLAARTLASARRGAISSSMVKARPAWWGRLGRSWVMATRCAMTCSSEQSVLFEIWDLLDLGFVSHEFQDSVGLVVGVAIVFFL